MPVFHTFTAGGKRYMFDANTNVIINLKDMKCIYEYEDIFNTIIDEIRRKRPTFQKIYDKNMEEFSRKC